MSKKVATQADIQRFIREAATILTHPDPKGHSWADLEFFSEGLEFLLPYIYRLEKVIERAEYEGAMARGDIQSMTIGQGLKRLDNCLNILKFKNPQI